MDFTPTPRPRSSIWGQVQDASEVAPGIWWVDTPGHGGFIISAERKAAMPPPLRAAKTFAGNPHAYEEDCDWCLVVLAFPALFRPEQIEAAQQTAQAWHKEAWQGLQEWLRYGTDRAA